MRGGGALCLNWLGACTARAPQAGASLASAIMAVLERALPSLGERRRRRRAGELGRAVDRGARLLDQREPNWHLMVDEDDINLPHTLPLAALYPVEGYHEYVYERVLGEYLAKSAVGGRNFIDLMVYFGFWADEDLKGEQERLWRVRLRERR